MDEASISIFDTPKELNEKKELLDFKTFKIKYNNLDIDILIGKSKNEIVISSFYYEIKFSQNELSKLTKVIYDSLDESYEFIKNSFEQNKVYIKDMTNNKLTLVIITYDTIKIKEKKIEINLIAQLKEEGYIIYNLINKYLELEQEMKNIKEDFKQLKI